MGCIQISRSNSVSSLVSKESESLQNQEGNKANSDKSFENKERRHGKVNNDSVVSDIDISGSNQWQGGTSNINESKMLKRSIFSSLRNPSMKLVVSHDKTDELAQTPLPDMIPPEVSSPERESTETESFPPDISQNILLKIPSFEFFCQRDNAICPEEDAISVMNHFNIQVSRVKSLSFISDETTEENEQSYSFLFQMKIQKASEKEEQLEYYLLFHPELELASKEYNPLENPIRLIYKQTKNETFIYL